MGRQQPEAWRQPQRCRSYASLGGVQPETTRTAVPPPPFPPIAGLNFTGWVLSDWGGTHSTVAAALAGLDQQMPDDSFFGAALLAAVQAGQVPEATIDDKVGRGRMPSSRLPQQADSSGWMDPLKNTRLIAAADPLPDRSCES